MQAMCKRTNLYRYLTLFLLSSLLFSANVFAGQFSIDSTLVTVPAKALDVYEDAGGKMTAEQVLASGKFTPYNKDVLNLGITESTFWIKVSLTNTSGLDHLVLMLQQPMIDEAELYTISNGTISSTQRITKEESFKKRKYREVDFIFDVNPLPQQTHEYLVKVRSSAQMVIPVKVGTISKVEKAENNGEILFGIYVGIILVMGIYNLFVYFTVRDRSYLLYVLYIFSIGFTQTTLPGFTYKFLWPNSVWLALNGVNLFSCLVSLAILEFIKEFLKTKEFVPKLNWGIIFFQGLFTIALVLTIAGQRTMSFQIMQGATGLASFYALFVSYKVYRKKYRPAGFFLAAWSVLLVCAIIFVLKDTGAIPLNTFTSYAIQIGSVIEIVLLSFALADRINILRREKEESQAQAMMALEENARIVREQNIILETKVTERTIELKASNEELNKTLVELKEAEMQLVESEKMASLGQLTAGIAHEINNPINFVTSNVKPLKRDVEMIISMLDQVSDISIADAPVEEKKQKIEDLKQEYDFDYLKTEIDYLLKGITEGSNRTAEIVKGLRIFSRLDEDDLKKASINEGLDSTIIIVNNLLEGRIEIEKQYGNIPMVECYPGKLNQVFLNIITNAIHALKSKFKDEKGGVVTIATSNTETTVKISIKDNGTGMDDNTKKKLFEPFFTTKDVGEGTGLGLSIAYNTIKKHNGTIDVISELGNGTEFVIEIPIIH
jgi:signal transduction histidine kinase